jgi:aryl-alcohol dehydrogenase-like predicted oxidoreductase
MVRRTVLEREGLRARLKLHRIYSCGIDASLTHIDTAEMYGGGEVEKIVAEAIPGRRARVLLASKILRFAWAAGQEGHPDLRFRLPGVADGPADRSFRDVGKRPRHVE